MKEKVKENQKLLPIITNKIMEPKTSENNVLKKPTKFIDASKLKQFSAKFKRKSDLHVNKKPNIENNQNLKVLNSNEIKINEPKNLELKKNSSKLRTKASSFLMLKKEKTLVNRAFDKTTFDKIDASINLKPTNKKTAENIANENKTYCLNLEQSSLKQLKDTENTTVSSCIVEKQTKKDNKKTDNTVPQIIKKPEFCENSESTTSNDSKQFENKVPEDNLSDKSKKSDSEKGELI